MSTVTVSVVAGGAVSIGSYPTTTLQHRLGLLYRGGSGGGHSGDHFCGSSGQSVMWNVGWRFGHTGNCGCNLAIRTANSTCPHKAILHWYWQTVAIDVQRVTT